MGCCINNYLPSDEVDAHALSKQIMLFIAVSWENFEFESEIDGFWGPDVVVDGGRGKVGGEGLVVMFKAEVFLWEFAFEGDLAEWDEGYQPRGI